MASGRDNPGVQNGQPRRMRSGPSQVCSFVRFINTTQRSIDIIWLNYEGIGVVYRTLRARQYVHVNTFVGHPWIFRDSATGDRMCVQTRDVYEPTSSLTESGRARRRLVFITNPLYTLRERCLQEVRRCVPPSQIEQLELPREILRDLLVRLPDVPILSSTMTSQDRSSLQPGASSAPDLASSSNPTSGSRTSPRTDLQSISGDRFSSDRQLCTSSPSASDSPSSSVVPSCSNTTSSAAVVASSGSCSNICTSTRSFDDHRLGARHQSRIVSVRDRDYAFAADQTDSNQLVNNNNNNDQAMDWNCNNNSSSAVNQNIQPASEVSSSQNGSAQYRNGELAEGSSAVSSSSSRRTVTSLRDRLLYQYLECSNGHDIVSSQVAADATWTREGTGVQADRQDGASSLEVFSYQSTGRNVVDSSSSLASLASCSHAARMPASSNLARSLMCTVTSSSEHSVADCDKVDDVDCSNECEVLAVPVPSSSSVNSQRVRREVSSIDVDSQSSNSSSRLPTSSCEVRRNRDRFSTDVELTLGPCHSNSEPGSQHVKKTASDTVESSLSLPLECESTDSRNGSNQNRSHSADRLATQSNDDTDEDTPEDAGPPIGQSNVNSTSSEGGKHGLSRMNEARLPHKKHRP